MQPRLIILAFFVSWKSLGQLSLQPEKAEYRSIQTIADALAIWNELHGTYVVSDKNKPKPYKVFQELLKTKDTLGILQLMQHQNAVVRGYAFWALAKLQYANLDSILIAHARDEERIRYLQGMVVSEVPLVDFMFWVVHPEILDRDSKKLSDSVIEKVQAIRYSN